MGRLITISLWVLLWGIQTAWSQFPGANVQTHLSGASAVADIALIASGTGTTGGGTTTSQTVAITIPGSTAQVVLFMAITVQRASGAVPAVTAVTYNGSATGITAVGSQTNTTDTRQNSYIYALVNPTRDGTSRNIVFTIDNAAWVVAAGLAYANVDQSTPYANANTSEGTNSSPTVTISSAADDLVFAHCGHRDDLETFTTNASQVERYNLATTVNSGSVGVSGAGSDEAGAASVAMDYTTSGTGAWSCVGMSIQKG